MKPTEQVEATLRQAFPIEHLEIIDNSWQHAGHVGNVMGGSHLRVVLVSSVFENQPLLQRHRLIHQVLKTEMAQFVHALELQLQTPAEWALATGTPD